MYHTVCSSSSSSRTSSSSSSSSSSSTVPRAGSSFGLLVAFLACAYFHSRSGSLQHDTRS